MANPGACEHLLCEASSPLTAARVELCNALLDSDHDRKLMNRLALLECQGCYVFNWDGALVGFAALLPARHSVFGAVKLVVLATARGELAANSLAHLLTSDSCRYGALLCRLIEPDAAHPHAMSELPCGTAELSELLAPCMRDGVEPLGARRWFSYPTVPGPAWASRAVVVVSNNEQTIAAIRAMFDVGYYSRVTVVDPAATGITEFSDGIRRLRLSGVEQVAIFYESGSGWLALGNVELSQRTLLNYCVRDQFKLGVVVRLHPLADRDAVAEGSAAGLARLWLPAGRAPPPSAARLAASEYFYMNMLVPLAELGAGAEPPRSWQEALEAMERRGTALIHAD